MKPMSASFLLRARWHGVLTSSTSGIVRSGSPAAAMQRTAQREKAFQATMRPNSNSDSSTLRGETRCDDETMPAAFAAPARAAGALCFDIGVCTWIVEDLLTIYLNDL